MTQEIVIPTNPADIDKIKKAAKEWSDSMIRVEGERDHQKAVVEMIEEELKLPRKYINKLFRQYHNNEFDKQVQENEDFIALYETVFG